MKDFIVRYFNPWRLGIQEKRVLDVCKQKALDKFLRENPTIKTIYEVVEPDKDRSEELFKRVVVLANGLEYYMNECKEYRRVNSELSIDIVKLRAVERKRDKIKNQAEVIKKLTKMVEENNKVIKILKSEIKRLENK